MKHLLVLAALLLSHSVFANNISETLMKEWNTFRALVETLEADGDVGGYMDYKEYGETTLLWRISDDAQDNEVIRFFRTRPGQQSFAVTYHKSHHIVPGTVVLRRFIGPEPSGWINHTIDFVTGDYFGQQGYTPLLTREEKELLEDWDITEL